MFLPWVKCSLCCASVGIFVVLAGIVIGWFVIPPIIDQQVVELVKLKPYSEAYERWREIPQALHFKVYFFHVVNPIAAMRGERIVVEEVGPYHYDQYRKKTLVISNKETDEYTYEEEEHFVFNKEKSHPLTEFDKVTILNTPLNAIAQISETEVSGTKRRFLNDNLNSVFSNFKNSMFHEVTVKDVLFDGYPICADYAKWSKWGLHSIARMVCNEIAALAPKTVVRNPDGSFRFSFFNHKNNTNEGVFTVKTGITNIKEIGQTTKFNLSEKLPFWKGENSKCNRIRGTDATIFPPLLSKSDKISIYNKDVCRSFTIEFSHQTSFKGVSTYRYNLTQADLAEPSEALETDCFCIKQTKDMYGNLACLKSGALDLYSCHNAPIILTLPHLYQADEFYVNNSVLNLKPDPKLHQTFVDLEPKIGYPLQGVKRIQLNMFVRPVDKISVTQTIKPALVPILWLDEGAELTDELVDLIHKDYLDVVQLVNYGLYGVVGLGIVIFVLSMFNFCHHHNKTYNKTGVTS